MHDLHTVFLAICLIGFHLCETCARMLTAATGDFSPPDWVYLLTYISHLHIYVTSAARLIARSPTANSSFVCFVGRKWQDNSINRRVHKE